MKKIVTISLGVFVLVLVVIFAMWFGSMQNQNNTNSNINQNQKEIIQRNDNNLVLDMQEVARHNSASDCWTVVRGKVYDVTEFSALHPGGEGAIIYNCGKDGTVGFDTKGGKGSHKDSALDVLSKYLIGDLVVYQGK